MCRRPSRGDGVPTRPAPSGMDVADEVESRKNGFCAFRVTVTVRAGSPRNGGFVCACFNIININQSIGAASIMNTTKKRIAFRPSACDAQLEDRLVLSSASAVDAASTASAAVAPATPLAAAPPIYSPQARLHPRHS